MDVGEHGFYVARHRESIVVGVARHTDDKVDVHRLQHLICLLGSTHLRECRRIAQAQFHILIVYLLLYAPVVLEHEGVVGVGHDQHVVDTAQHEIHECHVLQIETAELLRDGVLFHNQKDFDVIL